MRTLDFGAATVLPAPVPRATPAARAQRARIPWGFAEFFVISQTALPALLYLPGSQNFRLSIRVAAFAISLAAFAWWQMQPQRVRPHRATHWVYAVMALLALMLFHPTTSSMVGGLAHMMVYFAVLAPMFWAPHFVRSPEHLARLLGLLLICSGINSVVGVLQVYDPALWMPRELSRVVTEGATGLGPVTYTGPGGRLIVRPPGLFDTPGAVAGPGMFAALLGVVFGLSAIPAWQRAGAFALSAAGVAAIYLSQVRVTLVIAVVMFAAYAAVLFLQRRTAKAITLGVFAGGIIAVSFGVALTLGGDSVFDRVMTLFADDPMAVYYKSRGNQLDYTLNEMLFEFPFGAGLARWGMAAGYFAGAALPQIWAEIQITGWLIDGGILMVGLYGGALIVNSLYELRIARTRTSPKLAACGAVVFAANLGVAIMVITFTPYVTQIGIQYWFLAGALHGVAARARASAHTHG
jgi:hypothetical protein